MMHTISCRLCGGETTTPKYDKHTQWGCFEIVKCSNCTAEFIDAEVEVDDRDIQAHFFDENPYTENRAGVLARYWRNEAKFVESLGPKRGSVLDIGCNSGDFLAALGPQYSKFGVELAPEPAKQAREKGITIYDKPIEDCDFGDRQFDVITMFALIEHLRYPEVIIRELASLLKPGGLLVIMTGDADTWKSRRLKDSWHMYIPPLHRYFFTRTSLQSLCGKHGLEERSHRYTHGGMTFSSNSVLRLLEKATMWQLSQLPLIRKLPFYDHYYGYYIKQK